MQRMFPRALLACINENRSPSARELACVTEKVWQDAFAAGGNLANRQLAATLAVAAIMGQSTG
jgi:hypothetical protein